MDPNPSGGSGSTKQLIVKSAPAPEIFYNSWIQYQPDNSGAWDGAADTGCAAPLRNFEQPYQNIPPRPGNGGDPQPEAGGNADPLPGVHDAPDIGFDSPSGSSDSGGGPVWRPAGASISDDDSRSEVGGVSLGAQQADVGTGSGGDPPSAIGGNGGDPQSETGGSVGGSVDDSLTCVGAPAEDLSLYPRDTYGIQIKAVPDWLAKMHMMRPPPKSAAAATAKLHTIKEVLPVKAAPNSLPMTDAPNTLPMTAAPNTLQADRGPPSKAPPIAVQEINGGGSGCGGPQFQLPRDSASEPSAVERVMRNTDPVMVCTCWSPFVHDMFGSQEAAPDTA